MVGDVAYRREIVGMATEIRWDYIVYDKACVFLLNAFWRYVVQNDQSMI
jgi:hypothetical protein